MPDRFSSFCDNSLNIWVMLPPDQKRPSNRAAARFAVLNVDHLRKIMVQEMSEAASNSSMTSCTTRLAWLRMLISAMPSLLVVRFTFAPCCSLRAPRRRRAADRQHRVGHARRDRHRHKTLRVDAGDSHVTARQQLVAAPYLLLQGEARGTAPVERHGYRQQFIEAR